MGESKKAVQFARTGNPPDVVEVVDMETAPVRATRSKWRC